MTETSSMPIEKDDDAPLQMSQRRRADDEMDITPMIDITFLLLIFFVVVSKMDPTQTGRTPKADNGTAVSAKDSAVIFIRRGSSDKATVERLDGSRFADDEPTQMSEVIDYVNQEIDNGKKRVMLIGDANVSVGEVGQIRKIIGDAFEELSLTHIAVKEE